MYLRIPRSLIHSNPLVFTKLSHKSGNILGFMAFLGRPSQIQLLWLSKFRTRSFFSFQPRFHSQVRICSGVLPSCLEHPQHLPTDLLFSQNLFSFVCMFTCCWLEWSSLNPAFPIFPLWPHFLPLLAERTWVSWMRFKDTSVRSWPGLFLTSARPDQAVGSGRVTPGAPWADRGIPKAATSWKNPASWCPRSAASSMVSCCCE